MEESKEFTRIRFPTMFKTVEEAEAAKERLEIYDAEVSLNMPLTGTPGGIAARIPRQVSGLMGAISSCIPKHQRDWFIRRNIKMGIAWKIELVDGYANYIFLPSGPLLTGLRKQGNFGFTKIAFEVGKKMTELLGYQVWGIIE